MTRYRRTWNRVIGLSLICTAISATMLGIVVWADRHVAHVGGDVWIVDGTERQCEAWVRARYALRVPIRWIRRDEQR